jgi:ribosomal protein S18 acetylase RimI-like enzyme
MEKALWLPTEISASRLATPQDEALLFRLFAEDRADQLAAAGIPELQMQKLVEMQYRGQRTTYAARYPQAENRILITADSTPGGRVLIDREPARWRIVDVAVLAANRGKGLATRAIEECQAQCRNIQARLDLQVNPANPARRLYERLGFAPFRRRKSQSR